MSFPNKVIKNQRVIAFDFYDGVIEGLASSIKQHGKCYFKLIAWDQSQDKRLYIVSEADKLKYDKLLTLLTRTQEQPSTLVWFPKWYFYDEDDEQEANGIIEFFQISLYSSKLLALGRDICDNSLRIIDASNQAIDKLNKSLRLDKPEELSDWMAVLAK